ncbi:uncharacterized protein LOC106693924 [Microplitis demolitor]|uniref:uncharacterized protein LOC106693924 n=1 Tax=Microplitis demolitor TaxID=69319 RepID=UPI0006D4FB9D|nr:uncharacterized protein LOC106693924 [Microplitis demolitor]
MRPEIICITETHVIEDMENIELNIENYNNIGMTSENRRTGGVTTYLRKDIAYKEIKNVVDNQNEKNMWICSAELKGKYEGIIVSNIYHSPNQSHEQFINRLVEEAKNRERSKRNNNFGIIKRRDYSNFDNETFKELLENKCKKWLEKEQIHNEFNLDRKVEALMQVMMESIDAIAPVIIKRVSLKWQSKPWFNKQIEKKIRQKDAMYIKAKREKCDSKWCEYRKLRNETIAELRITKQNYYEEQIVKHKQEPKRMWKKLKEIVGHKRISEGPKEIIFDEVSYTDEKIIADKFNNYFIESIDKIVEELQVNERRELESYPVLYETKLDEFIIAYVNQIDKIIKKLDKNKGKNESISTDIIIKIWNVNTSIITELINSSIEEGIVPEAWKNSLIYPIQKVKGSLRAEDHRPINTLPVLEKILEEIIKKQLEDHVQRNNIISDEQSGFRTGHSCETALQKVIGEWRDGFDNGKMFGVLFLDLKRAFETVNINKLIDKLEMNYGISGKAIKWLASYLTSRTQQVQYGKVLSEKNIVKNGVPQGSKLGPLLFILYINDIVRIAKRVISYI